MRSFASIRVLDDRGVVAVELPYRMPRFVTAMRMLVPVGDRIEGNSGTYWEIDPRWAVPVAFLVDYFFLLRKSSRIDALDPVDGWLDMVNEVIRRVQPPPPSLIPNRDRDPLYVTDDAPPEVVRAAFRALSKVYHPDNPSGGDAERYKTITEAFTNLKRRGEA